MIPNFKIKSNGIISNKFLELQLPDFKSAAFYIKNLPYKRNLEKSNSLCVFNDFGGTCSTKHALLKNLSVENNFNDLHLMLGIFTMNASNTHKIATVLAKYQIKEMPEAHNYLKFQNKIIDCTTNNSNSSDFENDLVIEREIRSSQITDFKIEYHQKFLADYLQKNPQIPYSIEKFWQIREECIVALQQ